MSNEPSVSIAHASLWQRIAGHAFDRPGDAFSFSDSLAREHGWTPRFALAAIEEYRRFCFLAASSGHAVTPSGVVDEVWHLHLTHSRDYWHTWCPDVLACDLHHEPTRGGSDDARRHRQQYADTLASYQEHFGPPPEEFWPTLHDQFRSPARYRRVDLENVVVIPRLRLREFAPWRKAAALLAIAGITGSAQARGVNPLDWDGPTFLALFIGLFVVAIVASAVLRRRLRDDGRTHQSVHLDPWSAAYLAGGAERVMDAAVATLMSRGDAHWDAAQGRVVASTGRRNLEFPLDAVADDLRRTTATPGIAGPELQRSFDRLRLPLEQRGLLLDDAKARLVARYASLPFVLVALFGAIKIAIGVSRGRPVVFLVVLVIITAVVALIAYRGRPRLTRAGDATLRELRGRHAHATRAPRDADVGMAVALAGTAVLSGTAYAAYHQSRMPASSGSSDSSSSSSSSCSSGDSGGSSGCGGCGGGGGD